MLAVAVLGLIVVAVLAGVLIALGRVWPFETAYVRIAWVPAAWLALVVAFWGPLGRALSYVVIVLALVPCVVSLILGVVGLTLLTSGGGRRERSGWLVGATVLAGAPGALFVLYVLVSLIRFTLRG